MADFIAVIRRAVEGLSDNTPEMRAKVYDRARAAVVRQLENMKPRPPEAMFQKQLDKLDAAINQVEEEHGEALPADVAPEPTPQTTPIVAEPEAGPPAVEQVPEPEPDDTSDTLPVQAPVVSEPSPQYGIDDFLQPAGADDGPVTAEVSDHPAELSPAMSRTEPTHTSEYEPSPDSSVPETETAPDTDAYEAWPETAEAQERPSESPAPADERQASFVEEPSPVPSTTAATVAPQQSWVEPQQSWSVDIDEEPEIVPPVADESAVPMPKVSYDEDDVVSGFNEFVQQEVSRTVVPPPPKKTAKEDFSWDAPFDDLPDIQKPAAFEEALEAKQKELASQAATRDTGRQQPSARDELAELIGFDREPAIGDRSPSATATSDLPPDVTRAVSKLEGKSFRMHKKKNKSRINPLLIGASLAGVLVVTGGAYGLWLYKDDIAALVSSAPSTAETPVVSDKTETKTPTAATETTKTADDAAKQTEVASVVVEAGPQKFTQRLMADGSEADTSKSKLPVDQALTEGKNVFGQTEPGKEVASTDTTKPKADQPALGVTQKMFLYEERLGQSSPVAVPGTIVWSEKADSTDGKPNPTIEAQINIPERKITALMTFKRNTDPSLPASHIIEIVFAIPKDFPEGNVESVQRVAFKQTEQDRGDPLVAVPAKITDDFHMVALNDDADARKANLELMKRAWIDIPITYLNGRRALITLEKGASGAAIFDKVLAEWAALGNQTAN